MKTPRIYATPETFKQVLEQRLRTSSKSGAQLVRRRQPLVFDRLLARGRYAWPCGSHQLPALKVRAARTPESSQRIDLPGHLVDVDRD